MNSSQSDKLCLRCRVRGLVQGVFYRGSTRNRARELGLSGFARNLDDGSVEVLACGGRAAVDELRDWLWEGPRGAKVQSVDCQESTFQDLSGFSTV